jgi:hypothetical protein
MILLFLLAFPLTCATVILHAFGTWETIAHLGRIRRRKPRRGRLASEVLIVRTVSVLLALHFVEAGLWAVSYWVAGLLPDMETALYFSLTSYTTLGYGDVVLAVPSRLLGPLEGAVGILMFGWSTGVMVAVITRVYAERLLAQTDPPTADSGP